MKPRRLSVREPGAGATQEPVKNQRTARSEPAQDLSHEHDSPHQSGRPPPLPRRGVGARRIQSLLGRAHDRAAGSPNDLCFCERLSQPERRIRRHRCRGARRLRRSAPVGLVCRGSRGGAEVDSRQLQPAGSALSPHSVIRRDFRVAHRLFERAGGTVHADPRALLEFAQTKLVLASEAYRQRRRDLNRRFLTEARTLLERVIQLDASPARHAWAWRELARTLRWLRAPLREVEAACRRAIDLLPDERRFAQEWERIRASRG